MKKKLLFINIILLICILLTLCGCGASSSKKKAEEDPIGYLKDYISKNGDVETQLMDGKVWTLKYDKDNGDLLVSLSEDKNHVKWTNTVILSKDINRHGSMIHEEENTMFTIPVHTNLTGHLDLGTYTYGEKPVIKKYVTDEFVKVPTRIKERFMDSTRDKVWTNMDQLAHFLSTKGLLVDMKSLGFQAFVTMAKSLEEYEKNLDSLSIPEIMQLSEKKLADLMQTATITTSASGKVIENHVFTGNEANIMIREDVYENSLLKYYYTYEYDAKGRCTSKTRHNSDKGAGVTIVRMSYDPDSFPFPNYRVHYRNGINSFFNVYDDNGKMSRQDVTYCDDYGATEAFMKRIFDPRGNLLEQVYFNDVDEVYYAKKMEYNADQQLTKTYVMREKVQSQQEDYFHDYKNAIYLMESYMALDSEIVYNEDGNVEQKIFYNPAGTDFNIDPVYYEYDESGRVSRSIMSVGETVKRIWYGNDTIIEKVDTYNYIDSDSYEVTTDVYYLNRTEYRDLIDRIFAGEKITDIGKKILIEYVRLYDRMGNLHKEKKTDFTAADPIVTEVEYLYSLVPYEGAKERDAIEEIPFTHEDIINHGGDEPRE